MFSINTRVILFACILFFLSFCFVERSGKDKYPNILEFSEIINSDTINPEFEIIKTPYSEFGETKHFYFLKEETNHLTILNKNLEKLKRIKLKSKNTHLAVFDDFIFFIEKSDSYSNRPDLSDVIIKRDYPAFNADTITQISKPKMVYNTIRNTFPDSILNSFSNYTYTDGYKNMQHFDSLYCIAMDKEFSKDLKEVYEIRYPTECFILDYGDKMVYYYDERRFYRETCWPELKKQKSIRFRCNYIFRSKNPVIPFDKAFIEMKRNSIVGLDYEFGYQYYKLNLQSKEFKFKTYGDYQHPSTRYLEAYTSTNRDSILLQKYGDGSIDHTLSWIIERKK